MSAETQLLWHPPFGHWGMVVSAGLGLVILVLGALSTAGRKVGVRVAITALRGGAIALALLLLWRPSWRIADVTHGRDRVALLVDTSASMALPVGPEGQARAAQVRRLIAQSRSVLRGWSSRRDLDPYRFATALSRAAGIDEAAGRRPAGTATHLLAALDALRARYQGRHLAGVVVFSDGRATGPLRDGLTSTLTQRLRGLDVPINVVPVGRRSPPDVSVVSVLPDDLAFVRNVARIRVQLQVAGSSLPVTVTLSQEGRVLQRHEVVGGTKREVVFEITPQRVGVFGARIHATALPGEATLANNTRYFVYRVVRDRVRVLQIAGRPSWDVRFLRQQLKRDPNIDLVSFFILRTHLNPTYAAPHELSLIEFPAEQIFSTHLHTFDLVIMQDFERYPVQVGSYMDNVARYVRQGGALAVLGGEHTLSLGGFNETHLTNILPVVLQPVGPAAELLSTAPFKPHWTALAEQHPLTRAGGTPALSPAMLAELPRLEGLNLVARRHADAAVLATHPRLRSLDNQPAPVLALRDVEKGRVLILLTDSSWLWAFSAAGPAPSANSSAPGTGPAQGRSGSQREASQTAGAPAVGATTYDAFWRRAIRYLIRDPEYDRLRVLTAHRAYTTRRPVSLGIQALDQKRQPQRGVRVSWRLLDTGRRPPREIRGGQGTTDADGLLKVVVGPLSPGTFRVEAKAVLDGEAVTARGVLVAEGRAAELAEVAPNPALLRAIARATGGRALSGGADLGRARFHAPRIIRIDNLRTRPLAGSPWLLFVLLAGCLTAEWLVRRRVALR